jgi:alpha-beta hydrolase superfamily lysophospholipase
MADLQTFTDTDGVEISYRRWLPDGTLRATVQIAHGASEHSGRYARFAEFLAHRGYAVYANDHRGHGATAAVTGVGRAGPRGWLGMIEDLRELGAIARKQGDGRPLVLFGHSMGSFMAQLFAQHHGPDLDGLVLSGSAGGLTAIDETIALLEAVATQGGGDQPAPIFGPLNAAFEPARTPFDWLSRDEGEVDRYVADPLCGDDAPLTIDFVLDMIRNGADTWAADNEKRIPPELPVLMITGEADPVSDGGRTVRELEARYRANGMKDVTALYYPEARHELLNETNRDAVHEDVAAWLDRITA